MGRISAEELSFLIKMREEGKEQVALRLGSHYQCDGIPGTK